MTDGTGVPAKGTGAGGKSVVGQVAAAVLLTLPLLLGVWLVQDKEASAPKAPECPGARAHDGPEVPALCAALIRPGLPALLGVPDEQLAVAESGTSTVDGVAIENNAAEARVGQYRVRVADHREASPSEAAFLGSSVTEGALLGHRAVAFTERTIGIEINLFGGGGKSAPGGVAQNLAVAKGPSRGGGSYQLTVWRNDALPVDEGVVRRIATELLPTLPGWVADTAAPPKA
ncbi:DUF6215 domain-containing protein [Kitasatospora sp. NPDC004289]